MPRVDVAFFADSDGSCPLLEWLDNARLVTAKARTKCIVKVERLAELGHELRRPDAEYLA